MNGSALHLDPVKAALYLARRAHDGQRDKSGEPYIVHPLRVVRAMAADDLAGQVVAVLHGVVDESPARRAQFGGALEAAGCSAAAASSATGAGKGFGGGEAACSMAA